MFGARVSQWALWARAGKAGRGLRAWNCEHGVRGVGRHSEAQPGGPETTSVLPRHVAAANHPDQVPQMTLFVRHLGSDGVICGVPTTTWKCSGSRGEPATLPPGPLAQVHRVPGLGGSRYRQQSWPLAQLHPGPPLLPLRLSGGQGGESTAPLAFRS